jgi:putative membrane protein
VSDARQLEVVTGELAVVDSEGVPALHQHGIAGWAGRRTKAELRNWRLALVRVLTSGVAVVLTVFVIPGLRFRSFSVLEFLLIGVVFGLLNALVKPILQFFTLRYLLPTYGLVVVIINAVLLAMLSWLLGNQIAFSGLISLLLGGALVGIFGLLLDTLLGTTPPILDRSVVFDTESRSSDVGLAAAPPAVPAAAPAPISAAADSPEGQDVLRAAAAVLAGGEPDLATPPPAPAPAAAADEEVTGS